MGIVNYLAYREHNRLRVQTNDTMMGLLAGSKIAAQTLNLTSGSELRLREIFPRVEHIRRFNLKTEKAQEVLEKAEYFLGILAVPQVIALQEDVMVGMLMLLEQYVPGTGNLARGAKAANVHERFQESTGQNFTQESLELFHLLRVARNTHIHSGGKASSTLLNKISETTPQSYEVWNTITKTNFPTYQLDEEVTLGLAELIGTLAITKRLSEEANIILQRELPKNVWADIAVNDWMKTRRPGNPSQLKRQLLSLVRRHYAPLGLTEPELEAAQARI